MKLGGIAFTFPKDLEREELNVLPLEARVGYEGKPLVNVKMEVVRVSQASFRQLALKQANFQEIEAIDKMFKRIAKGETDKKGLWRFNLNKDLMEDKENPLLILVKKEGLPKEGLGLSLKISGRKKEWQALPFPATKVVSVKVEELKGVKIPFSKIQKINAKSMKRMEEGDSLVLYQDDAMRSLAEQILNVLAQVKRLIRDHLAIDPTPIGITLINKKKAEERITVEGETAVLIQVSQEESSLERLEEETLIQLFWASPHECVETTIGLHLYSQDPTTRWIGDGLAEYAGYLVTGNFSKPAQRTGLRKMIEQVEKLIETGRKTYDLTTEYKAQTSMVEKRIDLMKLAPLEKEADLERFVQEVVASLTDEIAAGYPVSLSFWLSLVDRHGEEVIKRFWQEIKAIEKPTNEDALRILSNLTGEDIKGAIKKIDLEDSLRILKEHLQK